MIALAGGHKCPRCEAPTAPRARFCTACGAFLESLSCAKCGQPLQEGARFCTGCGAPASSASNAPKDTALASTIAALELALYHAEPRRILQASLDALGKSPGIEEGTVASVTAMSAYAQLGDFEGAQSSLLDARRLFGAHLRLNNDQLDSFVSGGHLIDDLREAGDRCVRETPWLYFIMGHAYGPSLPSAYIGETETERKKTAMGVWAEFMNDQERFAGALGYLCLTNGQYREAAKHFETVLLIARRYETVTPYRIELLWPLVTLGTCYWNSQEPERATACWRRACSVSTCIEPDTTDDWGALGSPWIEQAKSRLTEHNIGIPPPEISLQAAKHLGEAVRHIVEAEQYEAAGVDLDQLADLIRRGGRRYTDAVASAEAELEHMERLDPYAWSRSPVSDSPFWYRYESASGYLWQKKALACLASDKLALAVAAYKQANEFWPTLPSYALMGGLQIACGLKADGMATYKRCIDQVEAFGAVDSSDDRREIVAELRQALHELGAA